MNYFDEIKKIGFIRIKIGMKPVFAGYSLHRWGSSAIRGALGNALLRRLCPQQKFICNTCQTPCSTSILFNTANPDCSEQAVNPYIIDYNETTTDNGKISFNITFFGNGLSAVDDVMLALKGGIFLGKEQIAFQLDEIKDSFTGKSLFDGFLLQKPEVQYIQNENIQSNRYCIEFLTPYRTKLQVDNFDFPQLIRAILRRTSTILRQMNIEPNFDYNNIISKSENIRTDYKLFTVESRKRYSSRTNSQWNVSGFTGTMIISGNFEDFLPLMRIAEIIGVGKLCIMGLGLIRVSALI